MADDASPALRIVARGISCRDCTWFWETDDLPYCDGAQFPIGTRHCRMDDELCGPEARWFLKKEDRDA